MNAALITDLEIILEKLASLEDSSGSETVNYEIFAATNHVEKAIAWERMP